MLLNDKNAVIYGGAGAIGSAVARAFAREGARVFLAGRTLAKLEEVADEINAAGGAAETAEVDALDQDAVEEHAAIVAASSGGIDVAINAVGVAHVQGPRIDALAVEEFSHPIDAYTRTNFITAKAVARHMVARGSGVILTLSTPGSRLAAPGILGNAAASGAVEAFSRALAGELGGAGVRVVCLRPTAIPEAVESSHTNELFNGHAELAGMTVSEWLGELANGALLRRLPTLDEVADYAAFVASDRAGGMTGAIANLTGGSLVD